MKTRMMIYIGAFAVLGGVAAWTFLGNPPEPLDPDTLAAQAVDLSLDVKDRVKATTNLIAIKEKDVLSQLRYVLGNSPDAEVKVQAIDGLAAHLDNESIPIFITNLNDSVPAVRQASYVALLRLYGGELPDKIVFKTDAPASERSNAAKQLKKIYEKQKQAKTTVKS